MSTPAPLKVSDVRFVKELYPRLKPHDDVVERYRDALDNLPPIVVARGGVLVDGYHRWQAHVRENAETIAAEDLGDLTDTEIIRESIKRNATHGQQLTQADKRRLAAQLWPGLDKDTRTAELIELLAVSERAVQAWTKEVRAVEKQQQKDKAWDLWLDCVEQQAIAAEFGVDEATISRWLQERKSAEMQPPDSRQRWQDWRWRTRRRIGFWIAGEGPEDWE